MIARIAKMLLPMAFGVLMVGAAAYRADGPALIVVAAALVAVCASAWWQPAATAAVMLVVLAVVVATPAPMHTVLAGLCAAAYLVLRHTDPTVPTTLFAVAFAAAGAAAVAVPVHLPWLPLLAPLALLAGYLVALVPYTRLR